MTHDRLSEIHLALRRPPCVLAGHRHRSLDFFEPQLVEFRLEVVEPKGGRLLLRNAMRRWKILNE